MIDHQHLRLFQFCDSQFPTGAFSHSFGLETYIQRETVYDTETFIKWLHLFINEQLTPRIRSIFVLMVILLLLHL